MSETATRIYILFLVINITLLLAGFSVSTPASQLVNATYPTGDVSDSSGMKGYLMMINAVINFFTGGGIIGLLVAAGMPYELQLLIGAPFFAIGIIMLAPLLKAGVGFVFSIFR